MTELRDMRESDIADYVRWFTTETEWGNWDAPWEPLEGSAEEQRKSWTEYYESVKALPDDAVRRKFEIDCGGVHIGWICRYQDLEYAENPEGYPALGLDIPDQTHRGNGNGTKAMRMFLDYLYGHGYRHFYTQTWSGNPAMIRLAEKLGFREVRRIRDYREVNGQKFDAITFRLDVEF